MDSVIGDSGDYSKCRGDIGVTCKSKRRHLSQPAGRRYLRKELLHKVSKSEPTLPYFLKAPYDHQILDTYITMPEVLDMDAGHLKRVNRHRRVHTSVEGYRWKGNSRDSDIEFSDVSMAKGSYRGLFNSCPSVIDNIEPIQYFTYSGDVKSESMGGDGGHGDKRQDIKAAHTIRETDSKVQNTRLTLNNTDVNTRKPTPTPQFAITSRSSTAAMTPSLQSLHQDMIRSSELWSVATTSIEDGESSEQSSKTRSIDVAHFPSLQGTIRSRGTAGNNIQNDVLSLSNYSHIRTIYSPMGGSEDTSFCIQREVQHLGYFDQRNGLMLSRPRIDSETDLQSDALHVGSNKDVVGASSAMRVRNVDHRPVSPWGVDKGSVFTTAALVEGRRYLLYK